MSRRACRPNSISSGHSPQLRGDHPHARDYRNGPRVLAHGPITSDHAEPPPLAPTGSQCVGLRSEPPGLAKYHLLDGVTNGGTKNTRIPELRQTRVLVPGLPVPVDSMDDRWTLKRRGIAHIARSESGRRDYASSTGTRRQNQNRPGRFLCQLIVTARRRIYRLRRERERDVSLVDDPRYVSEECREPNIRL